MRNLLYFSTDTAVKKDIHPPYYADAEIRCACGNIMHLGSTQKNVGVEICSACHPFYTGKEKLIDTAGRVEKFEKRRAAAKKHTAKKKTKKTSIKRR